MAADPPSRPVLRERYDHRLDIVVSHAAREFATRGFDATSMQDLITATGLTAGGLYHYIGSKDELLVRICDELMEPLLDDVREIADSDELASVQLRQIVRIWMAHVETHQYHLLVFQHERHVLERDARWDAVRRQRKDFETLLARVLERGERDGSLRFADRGLALRALLGMVNHTAQWFRDEGRLTAGQIADGYVDLMLGGSTQGRAARAGSTDGGSTQGRAAPAGATGGGSGPGRAARARRAPARRAAARSADEAQSPGTKSTDHP